MKKEEVCALIEKDWRDPRHPGFFGGGRALCRRSRQSRRHPHRGDHDDGAECV